MLLSFITSSLITAIHYRITNSSVTSIVYIDIRVIEG